MVKDKRFDHIKNDPKFRRIPKHTKKVKVDNRFSSMFEDKNFTNKCSIDKRGRPINYNTNDELKRYYNLSDDEKTEEVAKQTADLKTKLKSDKKITPEIRAKLKNLDINYARGESNLLDSSSSSDDDDEEEEIKNAEDDAENIEHNWGEFDKDADLTNEPTHRLAACNMNWDRIRSIDLMVLFNSFLPTGGSIKSVAIYPSEYGKERMKEEDVKGPLELVENDQTFSDDDNNQEGSKFHMERLRKYQLNRLKYYYAVITFNSPETADKIYKECDGLEYESSATKLDLRYIPNDMIFDEMPKDSCDKLPEIEKYQPRFFTTTALQQAKVDLTWDETDTTRLEIREKLLNGKIDDITKADLENYLADDDDDDEDESDAEDRDEKVENAGEEEGNQNSLEKYKNLLKDIENKEIAKKNQQVEMQITWGINTKSSTELLKKKMQEKQTPFERMIERKKEKKKAKKEMKNTNNTDEDDDIPSDIDLNDPYFAEEFRDIKKNKTKKVDKKSDEKSTNDNELELLMMDNQQNDEIIKNKKKKKNKRAIEDKSFEIDVKDERFAAVYNSHHFNIDPTDPHFEKTKGMEKMIEEKIKRRKLMDDNEKPHPTKKSELNVLVKSIKQKYNKKSK